MLRAAEDHQQATRSLAEPEVINYCISNRKRRESPTIFLFLSMRWSTILLRGDNCNSAATELLLLHLLRVHQRSRGKLP